MTHRFQNHTGLFVHKHLYPNCSQHKGLCAIRFHSFDVFDRPQFAVDGMYAESWEGHRIWDRFTAIIFDVFGFLEPFDGTLSLGGTYEGEPLRFERTALDLQDFDFEPAHCIELYLSHLENLGHLELVGPEHQLVQSALETAELQGAETHAFLTAKFDDLGFLQLIS